MAKKAEKAVNDENQMALTPAIENPKLLAKLKKLAADNGISVQEMVNVKIDELRNGVAEITTQPVKSEPSAKPEPSNVSAKLADAVSLIEQIVKTLVFSDKRDREMAKHMLQILEIIYSI